jgi:hypothetical protein
MDDEFLFVSYYHNPGRGLGQFPRKEIFLKNMCGDSTFLVDVGKTVRVGSELNTERAGKLELILLVLK